MTSRRLRPLGHCPCSRVRRKHRCPAGGRNRATRSGNHTRVSRFGRLRAQAHLIGNQVGCAIDRNASMQAAPKMLIDDCAATSARSSTHALRGTEPGTRRPGRRPRALPLDEFPVRRPGPSRSAVRTPSALPGRWARPAERGSPPIGPGSEGNRTERPSTTHGSR